jgi:hypothetical protein
MKKIVMALPTLLVVALPLVASAHEHDTFIINGSTYSFVVGSLNEPLVVDDKTGLDLTITKGGGAMTMSADGDMDGAPAAAVPVTGLENSLKLELVAGSAKKSLDISPQYGKAGAYTAAFYPTVATTFSYHLTGEIDSTPVDLTFTCVPEGTPKAADDTSSVKISDSVTRTLHSGAFGCPLEKENLGFPEDSVSIRSLADAKGTATTGFAIGLAALALAAIAFVSARRR